MVAFLQRFGKSIFLNGVEPLRGKVSNRFFTVNAAGGKSNGPWNTYLNLLEKKPILTKAVTSGILTFTADIVCQLYQPSKSVRETLDEEKKTGFSAIQYQLQHLDYKRLGIFTSLGVFYIAPCLHFWYGFLMRAVTGLTIRATATRVFFDQSCFAPTFLAGLFSLGLILEGKSDQIKDKLMNELPPTVMMNWTVWIPSMMIMFRFCPAHLQVLFSNSIGFFWNIYLTWAMNKEK
jgi:hypothetical protein